MNSNKYNLYRTLLVAMIGLSSVSCNKSDTKVEINFVQKLPDTGQTSSYTGTRGEDSDYTINPPSYTNNGNGTITDNITGLMWQKADGGEMTFEKCSAYIDTMRLGGYKDWRLPTGFELFSLNFYDKVNPALNTNYFTVTSAEYWWTGEKRADNETYIWVVNAGGGIGAHLKTETVSTGGSRRFHLRAVRNPNSAISSGSRFTDKGDGTIYDNITGLTWQQIHSATTMTWEESLSYAATLALAGKSDWRVPNVKELQSLNDPGICKPSFNKTFFTNSNSGNFWSSTSQVNNPAKAWDINIDYGIVSYNDKTVKEYVLCVRGGG